jgi:membrane dipeptidase
MANPVHKWTRRKFTTSLLGAGAAMLASFRSSSIGGEDDPHFRNLLSRTMGVDTHNHVDVPFSKTEFAGQRYDLPGEFVKSGFAAVCMTFCVDRPPLKGPGDAYERFLMVWDEHDALLQSSGIGWAKQYADVKKAFDSKRPIVVRSIEGGHFVEGKPERIAGAYQRGLRHFGLMHDGQTTPPLGDIYTDPARFNGLTEDGKTVVRECVKQGILVDLAHCSWKAVEDALALTTKPMIISHTGLDTELGSNENMARMMMPRLISKEHARAFASAGGVIGVWTHLADSPTEYVQRLSAMANVVGAKNVCIGTDTKIATPVGVEDRFGRSTNKSWDGMNAGFLPTVVDAMVKAGFRDTDIMDIAGGNYWRIFESATSAAG